MSFRWCKFVQCGLRNDGTTLKEKSEGREETQGKEERTQEVQGEVYWALGELIQAVGQREIELSKVANELLSRMPRSGKRELFNEISGHACDYICIRK